MITENVKNVIDSQTTIWTPKVGHARSLAKNGSLIYPWSLFCFEEGEPEAEWMEAAGYGHLLQNIQGKQSSRMFICRLLWAE